MNSHVVEQPRDILALIRAGKKPTLDWFPEGVPPSQLAPTLVGMANSDGGSVILGVSPRKGEPVGIRDLAAAQEKVFQAAILSEPTLVLPVPVQVKVTKPGLVPPVTLLIISIPPGLPHVYSYEGKYFTRQAKQTRQLPASRLYQLLNERGAVQFESQLVPEASLKDLDSKRILAYATSIGNLPDGNMDEAANFLVKRGCLKRVGNELKLTYAALLLFGISPQQWLPNATILAGRFPGYQLSDVYIKQDITGNLPEQLTQAERFIRANLKTAVRLVGFAHEERIEYPFEAVRELLVNAVAHRDYNLQGDNIHLNIYADRLVVSSPGTLPGPVTLDNLLVARFARNAVISQVLSDLGYVERLGYGIDRVVSVMQKEGLPPPRFEENAGTFQATLLAGYQDERLKFEVKDLTVYAQLDVNPRQELALAHLAIRHRITSHDYQSLCPGVHAETLRRDLADLVSQGVLIKVGDKKTTYYILKRS
jgi:ATP-dependent DNA helicase RecG